MKNIPLFFLMVYLINGQQFEYEDNVMVVTDENIDDAIKKFPYLLLETYAPWCGPCKQFAPEYARLSKIVEDEKLPVKVAKVDGTVNRIVSQMVGLQGYPDVKLFINGFLVKYHGMPQVDGVLEFLRSQTKETLDELVSLNDVQEFLADFPIAIVQFFEPSKQLNLNMLNVVSKVFEDIVFGYTTSEEAREHYKVRKNNVVLFKDFEEGRNDFKGKLTDQLLIKFIDENAYPAFSELDERAEFRIFKRAKSALFLMWKENDKKSEEWRQVMEGLAPLIKKRIQLVFVNPKDGFLTSVLERLDTQSVSYPDLFFYNQGQGQRPVSYRFKDDFNEDNVLRFIEFAELGKLVKNQRSQPIPENPIVDNVLTIVGDTFEDVVQKSGKDALVLFWSESTKESKEFQKNYQILGRILRANSDILIGQIQVPENEVAGLKVDKVPTLKFWTAKQPSLAIDYTDKLEEKYIISFVKKTTSFKWVPLKNDHQYDL